MQGLIAISFDRDDREIKKDRAYAVRTEWGCTIKFLLLPFLNLRTLTYDPIVGRVIWNWQSL